MTPMIQAGRTTPWRLINGPALIVSDERVRSGLRCRHKRTQENATAQSESTRTDKSGPRGHTSMSLSCLCSDPFLASSSMSLTPETIRSSRSSELAALGFFCCVPLCARACRLRNACSERLTGRFRARSCVRGAAASDDRVSESSASNCATTSLSREFHPEGRVLCLRTPAVPLFFGTGTINGSQGDPRAK